MENIEAEKYIKNDIKWAQERERVIQKQVDEVCERFDKITLDLANLKIGLRHIASDIAYPYKNCMTTPDTMKSVLDETMAKLLHCQVTLQSFHDEKATSHSVYTHKAVVLGDKTGLHFRAIGEKYQEIELAMLTDPEYQKATPNDDDQPNLSDEH
jgi:hypothetical protein